MRFLRHLAILLGIVGIGIGVGGWQAGWDAHGFTVALGLVCMFALFIGTAALGGTGPRQSLGAPRGLIDVVTSGRSC